ncbi:MAG TPA: hypothetical protein VFG87_27280 [Amycolatopsis sp.]|nr:hypothetical protein [Amycolatopsis sp.]
MMILAALGVTGFWAPGFLVTKNNVTKSNAAGATPQRALQTLVDALNQHDQVALTALECADADLKITNAIRKVAGVSNASIVSGPTRVSDTEYDGVVDITYNGESQPFTGKLALESDGWCWKDAGDPPTPS